MQTNFSPAQLVDPDMASSESIIRKCVHCGFCTATCPTFVELGDELDSPRGRIYLIKDMLENDRAATQEVVKHIDRCLSCLSCMTTCPSGVHYGHLVDHARAHIEETYERPFMDRAIRALLAQVLPYRNRFRLALLASVPGKLLRPPFARWAPTRPLAAMLDLAPGLPPARSPTEGAQVFAAEGRRVARVALLSNCAQPVIAPQINEATIRLLNRHGVEVVIAKGEGCCGAIVHHMGREAQAMALARRTIDAWTREMDGQEDGRGLDAIVVNVSGCGTTVKDYGHLFRDDPLYAEKAARVSAIARDISEVMHEIGLIEPVIDVGLVAAYHSACSMQHGQRVQAPPRALLRAAGFTVKEVPESHLCCGSAGTYNILQPEIAGRLRARKVRNIESVAPDLVATGNVGCITQITKGTAIPVIHTAELLDWATGGPVPVALAASSLARRPARADALQAAE